MNKLSLTIASAALVSAALPLGSGCSQQSSGDPAAEATGRWSVSEQDAKPLTPVAIPPTLQTIAFDDPGNELFAAPPSPRLCSESPRGAAEAEPPAAATRRPAVVSKRLPPIGPKRSDWELHFPASDPAELHGAGFDYLAEAEPTNSPSAAEPRASRSPLLDPSAREQPDSTQPEVFTIAPPANARRGNAVEEPVVRGRTKSDQAPAMSQPSTDSQWQAPGFVAASQPSVAEAKLSPEAPSFDISERAGTPPRPFATANTPKPLTPPSRLADPMLADTREWRSSPAADRPLATPRPAYPGTSHAAALPQPVAAPYAQEHAGPELLRPGAARQAPTPVEPLELPPAAGQGMQVVRHHAQMLIDRGVALGERGALYSAKADFQHALRLIAEAQDAASGNRRQSEALARAWQTLAEAEDFAPGGARTVDMRQIVPAHRTELLKQADLSRVTPLEAAQQYFAYAQQQLAIAGGEESSAAQALHHLGKTHAYIARESNDAARTHGPLALAMQQAALMVDDHHDGAANELGVLLAKYGQWSDARRVLLHGVRIRPTAEKWSNLAVVHEHLGEARLAQMATRESEALLALNAASPGGPAADGRVQWVDPAEFAGSGKARPAHLPTVQSRPEAKASKSSGTAWKWPWFK